MHNIRLSLKPNDPNLVVLYKPWKRNKHLITKCPFLHTGVVMNQLIHRDNTKRTPLNAHITFGIIS